MDIKKNEPLNWFDQLENNLDEKVNSFDFGKINNNKNNKGISNININDNNDILNEVNKDINKENEKKFNEIMYNKDKSYNFVEKTEKDLLKKKYHYFINLINDAKKRYKDALNTNNEYRINYLKNEINILLDRIYDDLSYY